MRIVVIPALVALGLVLFPLRGWSAEPSFIHIPKKGEPGWDVTTGPGTGSSGPAPSGYEGRTDSESLTANGKDGTPQAGKHITASFTLGNKIKTCPLADGTAEGDGVLSFSVDSQNAQSNGTDIIHIEIRAEAQYKGQVDDSGYLAGPVNAEIDYSYTQTGRFRSISGGILNNPPVNVHQHITIPFAVSRQMEQLPSIGDFSGGDPLQTHYVQAVGLGYALTFWGGIFYSMAQAKWTHGQCAQIAFNPPSNTVALGAQVTVKADVKTKAGEVVRANFGDAHAYAGTVVPEGIGSNVGSPMKFTYVAPDKKVPNAGFSVKATSRAGNTEGEWKAGLGTGWNGEISCTQEFHDGGNVEVQTFSGSSVTRIIIDVKNGVGTAHGYASASSFGVNRQPALRGGVKTLIISDSSHGDGTLEDSSPAKVEVFLNQNNGTYSISADYEFKAEGKIHGVMCGRDGGNCQQADGPLVIASCFGNTLRGKFSDPTQLHGSARDDKTHGGMYGNGTSSNTVTWDLGRQGSGK